MSRAILDALMMVLDEDHAVAVIAHRKVTIKKPLTEHAAKLLAKRLAEWGDANAAADIMVERCWQGFDSSWVRDRRRPTVTGNSMATGHGLMDALMRRAH